MKNCQGIKLRACMFSHAYWIRRENPAEENRPMLVLVAFRHPVYPFTRWWQTCSSLLSSFRSGRKDKGTAASPGSRRPASRWPIGNPRLRTSGLRTGEMQLHEHDPKLAMDSRARGEGKGNASPEKKKKHPAERIGMLVLPWRMAYLRKYNGRRRYQPGHLQHITDKHRPNYRGATISNQQHVIFIVGLASCPICALPSPRPGGQLGRGDKKDGELDRRCDTTKGQLTRNLITG